MRWTELMDRVFVFPETLYTSVIVKRLYEKVIRFERVQKMTSDKRSIFTVASTIHTQVRNTKRKMPWLPQAADLKTKKIELGEYFSVLEFLAIWQSFNSII